MFNLVFLPATAPDNDRYGVIPKTIDGYPDVTIHRVHFSREVWYNKASCAKAIEQIRALNYKEIVLIGFSKSGLGAWQITQALPDLIKATIIFDAPVARLKLPPWETEDFYADDAAWQADLPLLQTHRFQANIKHDHKLILIPGDNFNQEMHELSSALCAIGHEHILLNNKNRPHHWNAGWIEAGLNALTRKPE